MSMAQGLFASTMIGNTQEAMDFITTILQASTEDSIIGTGLDGTILLWNEGARRLYGYEAEEVLGTIGSQILHTHEDLAAGVPSTMAEESLRQGKWEGFLTSVRKNGQRFRARVV